MLTKVFHRFHDRPGLTMDICSICADRYTEIQIQLAKDLAAAHRESIERRVDRAKADRDIAELAAGIVRGCSFTP